ncbi:ribosomal large subunit pseudouridine synthase E [Hydrogenophilus thermoluteolus]|uniref:pseudouridine synthase n=1 Tax=Hydrogenophilus thermoluteolus TaxID=297 RepID=UPI0024A4B0DA|nr:pseudouridine synthase [Hydrogenophilus thermoluteolus]GLW61267.1 ribosomal large subunit pseudouridine synthase E [Hydrogenophilus thermoluteolus]
MPILIAVNKPYGVLSQFSGEPVESTLRAYVPVPNVYPAGRLDKESEGLLLLTDYGPWQARISDPRFKWPKTYWVQVEGEVSDTALAQLRNGVRLKDGLTLPAHAVRIAPPELWPRVPPVRFRKSVPTSWIALTLREGRNRQVRRMTAAVGFPTLRLVRIAIGPYDLRNLRLQPGEWRIVKRGAVGSRL